MLGSPKNLRTHIGLFGRRNVGKSSLLNALVSTPVSLVSAEPGTTTDPVEKPMELLPIGPVLFIDTAGIDDYGALGELRVGRTRQVLDRVDIGVVVSVGGEWGPFERDLVAELQRRQVPVVAVLAQVDAVPADPQLLTDLHAQGLNPVAVSALHHHGLHELRLALQTAAGQELAERPLLADLVPPGKVCVLVVPVDKEAPKGRLILPQAQAARDLLDHGAIGLVVQDRELPLALAALREPPALVVTDSQAFGTVAQMVPPEVPLTSFSIVFARFEGDLPAMAKGALALDRLQPGDAVLLAEQCTHHPNDDDIARVKIPRWLDQKVGGPLRYEYLRGHQFPDDIGPYKVILHCGNCTGNRRELLARQRAAARQGVALTNFGVAIAHLKGILDRALAPFPQALQAVQQARQEQA
ncbi:MAG: [FeFe] hydrogenase H-cluster maturation GTPase HydF [Deltaproteobacteria bacterium]|nr:[FeFe] hydrogenase H-cluster maturation GTPase HydF [Deltaproteobacteria bacterium]